MAEPMEANPAPRMTPERMATVTAHLEAHGMLPEEYAEELLANHHALLADIYEARRNALLEAAEHAEHGADNREAGEQIARLLRTAAEMT
jgi:hypothetical protein